MFLKKTETVPTALEDELDRLLTILKDVKPESDEYGTISDQLVKLHTLMTNERPERVSPDVLATIAANLAGLLLILNYERAGIVTSKGLALLMKLKS